MRVEEGNALKGHLKEVGRGEREGKVRERGVLKHVSEEFCVVRPLYRSIERLNLRGAMEKMLGSLSESVDMGERIDKGGREGACEGGGGGEGSGGGPWAG